MPGRRREPPRTPAGHHAGPPRHRPGSTAVRPQRTQFRVSGHGGRSARDQRCPCRTRVLAIHLDQVTSSVSVQGSCLVAASDLAMNGSSGRARLGACASALLSLLLSRPCRSSLGYELCDARLWHLGRSLVTSVASGNPVRYLVPEPPSLRCLALSRRVRFTNRFTETVLDARLRTHSTGVSGRDLSRRPSATGTF